jgi:hypothetical protein
MGYFGLVWTVVSALCLRRIYRLRRGKPDVHATVPPVLDLGLISGWGGVLLGILITLAGFCCQ